MSTGEKIICLTPLTTEFFKSSFNKWIDFSKIELEIVPGDASEDEVCEAIADATIIVGDGRHRIPITRRVMEAALGLKLVQMPTVGYDEVDLAAADDLGIPVANAQGSNALAVAEHAMMFMLVLLKKGLYSHEATSRGDWPQMELAVGGNLLELGGRTLGILGLGAIGNELARMACAFGPRIIYYKRNRLLEDEEEKLGVQYVGFDELITQSDILSIHVPLTDETRGLIGRDEIARMKPGAILLNLARGGIVDDSAVVNAVREGRLTGAGLDVFQDEPVGPGNIYAGIDNLILSPHVSGGSSESFTRAFKMSGENMARAIAGEKPKYLVNMK